MHEDKTDRENSLLRVGAIPSTLILSALVIVIRWLSEAHTLTKSQATWSMMFVLPAAMACMVKRRTPDGPDS